MNGYGRGISGLTPVVKNLIIINSLVLLASYLLERVYGFDLSGMLGLYFPRSDNFRPHQLLTYMFMHTDFWHLFFNMYALFIFGQVLENTWGPRRFLTYYLVCGFGAVLVHETVLAFEYKKLVEALSPDQLQTVLNDGYAYFSESKIFTGSAMQDLQLLLNTPTVGASGAIFGVLLAFGVLFPKTRLMLLFPPIPLKAKYFVMGYGAIELYLAFSQPGSNIAHVAHLGGMLFGYLMIRYWRKTTTTLF
jgi:membrane associated rhomboid family serine protease